MILKFESSDGSFFLLDVAPQNAALDNSKKQNALISEVKRALDRFKKMADYPDIALWCEYLESQGMTALEIDQESITIDY